MSQGLMLENPAVDWRIVMQLRAQFYAVCAGNPNCSALMLYDVTNYNDVTFAISSYELGRNTCFIGV